MREITRARELDPLSQTVARSAGDVLYHSRQYAESLDQYRAAGAHFKLGDALFSMGRYAESLSEYRIHSYRTGDPGKIHVFEEIEQAYLRGGAAALIRRCTQLIGDAARSDPWRAYLAARNYAIDGQPDRAFEMLGKAVEIRDPNVLFIRTEPDLDALRRDPRYAALLSRIGLPR